MPRKSKAAEPVNAQATTAIVATLTLEQRIDRAITLDGTFDTQTHLLAVETLQHAETTGDFTMFAKLIGDVTTKGGVVYGRGVRSRRLALIEWATAFSPIRVNGDGVIGVLAADAKGYKPYNTEGAEALPFFEMPTEKRRRETNAPFDVAVIMGRIGSFGKAIDKAVENGSLNDNEEALRTLASEVQQFAIAKAAELGLSSDAAKARRTQAAA